jgi:hypothetical protein
LDSAFARLAAFVLVISVAIDPFFQQLISYPVRTVPSSRLTASVNETLTKTNSRGRIILKFEDVVADYEQGLLQAYRLLPRPSWMLFVLAFTTSLFLREFHPLVLRVSVHGPYIMLLLSAVVATTLHPVSKPQVKATDGTSRTASHQP